ncbi:MAG: hypothetical protein J6129_03810 [Bacteroidaceae bacterium]|nr:hypothetical protein [Bacteroidaceae bacterium]
MKKITYFAALLLVGLTFSSCAKEDIEDTATVDMAGQWYVDVDAVDENGDVIDGYEHYFGYDEPRVLFLTYNTADNNTKEMYIDDLGAFDLATYYDYGAYPNYAIKCKVNIDYKNLTFSSVEEADNESSVNEFDSDVYPVTITGGKILKGAGRQNNGSVADSIVFFVEYAGDPWYPDDGYTKYRVSGIRYSGLVEND